MGNGMKQEMVKDKAASGKANAKKFAETARLREVNSKQLLTSVEAEWVDADSKTRPAGPNPYARNSFQVDPAALASGLSNVESFSFGQSQNRGGRRTGHVR